MKRTITITAKVIKPKKKPGEYNKKQLKKGTKVESEHTTSKKLQKNIAKNHLDEDSNYYKKLDKIEKKTNKKKGCEK